MNIVSISKMNVSYAEKVSILSPGVLNVYEQIKKYLATGNAATIPYFKLIINPKNYAETKRNAKDVGMLYAYRLIDISMGRDGFPAVDVPKPCNDLPIDMADTNADICLLSKSLCEYLIAMYDIEEPMLKRFI